MLAPPVGAALHPALDEMIELAESEQSLVFYAELLDRQAMPQSQPDDLSCVGRPPATPTARARAVRPGDATLAAPT